MSFGSRREGEVSVCCNAQVWREPKLSGYKPYCDKCKKRCDIKNRNTLGICDECLEAGIINKDNVCRSCAHGDD